MSHKFFGRDGYVRARPIESRPTKDNFEYPSATREEIDCCLNCDSLKCTGNCSKVKEARKRALAKNENKNNPTD